MKPLALLLAAVPLLSSILVGFLVLFLLTFPFENDGGPDPATASVYIAGWIGSFACAVALFAAIALDRLDLAATALALHLTAALVLLAVALHESQHSEDTLLAFALPIEAAAVLAVVVGRRDAAPTSSRRPDSNRGPHHYE